MANTKKSNKTTKTNGTITLDFTEAYKKHQEYLDEPCKGSMPIPEKTPVKISIWKKIKNWFKRKK